ncbi:MAG: hypothetical protein LJE59_03120, partial [Chromatiaceae bacterium]|nr:hypothetical protein [Chromatiaceae bacterium]
LQDALTRLIGRGQSHSPDKVNGNQGNKHDQRDDRREVCQEIVECQSNRRTDRDVGRITSQGSGTTIV